MWIESLIRRKAGTTVQMGGETYHFKSREGQAAHICEVTNEEHARRFLGITEGYAPFEGKAPEKPKAQASKNNGSRPVPEGSELPMAKHRGAGKWDVWNKDGVQVGDNLKKDDALAMVEQLKQEG